MKLSLTVDTPASVGKWRSGLLLMALINTSTITRTTMSAIAAHPPQPKIHQRRRLRLAGGVAGNGAGAGGGGRGGVGVCMIGNPMAPALMSPSAKRLIEVLISDTHLRAYSGL